MADFNIRSESVDVEQIMKQIRARIQEKRGVDYTEDQIRELATVRLEKFLDPKNLRSDLLEQFRRSRPALPEPPKEPPPVEPPYTFDDQTLFASHRGSLRFIRNMLRPILKLFFNPNTLNQVLHTQAQFNVDMIKRDLRRRVEMQMFDRSRAEWNILYYEVLHNLVLETTRNAIELKNMKMTLEALASRLDFSERRVRALEGVVQYRPEAIRPRPSGRSGRSESVDGRDRDRDRSRDRAAQPESAPSVDATDSLVADVAPGSAPVAVGATGGSDVGTRRRRRRRRGRRGTGMAPAVAPGADETSGMADSDVAANEVETVSGHTGAASGGQAFDEGDDLEGSGSFQTAAVPERKPDGPSNETLDQTRDSESSPRRDPDQQ